MTTLSIGDLALAARVKVPTIRYYEQIGLLPTPARSRTDRRIYGEESVKRLTFIRHARQLGFGTDAIRSLLDLSDHPERPCRDATTLVSRQLEDVEAKIDQLIVLRNELQQALSAGCSGSAASCRMMGCLAEFG